MNDSAPDPKLPQPEAVRAFYDRFSSERLQHYSTKGNLRIDKALARILPLIREESVVVEIGCGTALVAEQIARIATHGSVWACDLSSNAIAIARRRVNLPNLQLRALDVIAGSGFREIKAWLQKPADIVVLVDVIEHIPLSAHGNFFANVAQLVHADSRVVLTFPSPGYQRYLRQHNPAELQIIDETVELSHLNEVAGKSGFLIKHYSLEDVWLPDQYVHCILARPAPFGRNASREEAAMERLALLIPSGEQFVFVDQTEWTGHVPRDRKAIPFLERDGVYWGAPANDQIAVEELERLRARGANYIVFAAPAFWWLDYYPEFHQHIRSRFVCLSGDDDLVVFDLRSGG